MNSTSQVIKQNTSFILFLGFRRTCWCLAALALLSAVLTLSCGGPSATAPAVQVSLSPQTAQVVVQGQVQFTATVSGSGAGVTWSVNGTAGGSPAVGTINGAGLYTAPGIPPSTNTVTVTAASLGAVGGGVGDHREPGACGEQHLAGHGERRKREHQADGDGDGFHSSIGGGVGGHGAGHAVCESDAVDGGGTGGAVGECGESGGGGSDAGPWGRDLERAEPGGAPREPGADHQFHLAGHAFLL